MRAFLAIALGASAQAATGTSAPAILLHGLLLGLLPIVGVAVFSLHRHPAVPPNGSGVESPSARDKTVRRVYAQIRWMVDHVDADLARWQAVRGARLVEVGRLSPHDRAWADLQRSLPDVQTQLSWLAARVVDPEERDAVRHLARRTERLHDCLVAALRHLQAAGTSPQGNDSALHAHLEAARAELDGALQAFAVRFGYDTEECGQRHPGQHHAATPQGAYLVDDPTAATRPGRTALAAGRRRRTLEMDQDHRRDDEVRGENLTNARGHQARPDAGRTG